MISIRIECCERCTARGLARAVELVGLNVEYFKINKLLFLDGTEPVTDPEETFCGLVDKFIRRGAVPCPSTERNAWDERVHCVSAFHYYLTLVTLP